MEAALRIALALAESFAIFCAIAFAQMLLFVTWDLITEGPDKIRQLRLKQRNGRK